MANISVTPISNLNAYRVTATDGSFKQASYALYALDAHGKVSSQPLTYDGVINDDRIYRDPATNQLYFKTDLQSRFLDYGYDPATGRLVMEDYTGAQLAYDRGAAMDPRLRTDNPNDMDDARKAFIANGDINAYSVTLDGVTYDQLSVSRLLLILTLARAEKIEGTLVEEMNKLAENNAKLEAYSQIADLAVKSEYVDIYQTTIVYKGETVTIADFLTEQGVDFKQMLAAAKAQEDSLKTEWDMNRHAAFKAKYDSVPYLTHEQSLLTLTAGIDSTLYPGVSTNPNIWIVGVFHAGGGDPYFVSQYDETNGELNDLIRTACDERNLEKVLNESCEMRAMVLGASVTCTVKEFVIAWIGQANFDKCWALYNVPEPKIDNSVLSHDLLEVAKNQQDSLNNLSQETMINIQSLITARDQSYLLGSNGLKLLQNGNIMVARNI